MPIEGSMSMKSYELSKLEKPANDSSGKSPS